MNRKTAADFDQELLILFDAYVHGAIDRRGFLDKARKFAVGGVTAAMLLDQLNPNFAEAQVVAADDKRIKTADLSGRVETAVELPFIPNAFGFRRDGSPLVGDAMQRKIYRWDGKALQPLASLADITVFCLSDGIVDAQDEMAHPGGGHAAQDVGLDVAQVERGVGHGHQPMPSRSRTWPALKPG